ncbi:MAG: hypothetical protein M0Z39_03565 [Actinomycetota bacterium]|jgi:hypothetical protein|nr:hypothetical protein [Actinomycetota bacterium]
MSAQWTLALTREVVSVEVRNSPGVLGVRSQFESWRSQLGKNSPREAGTLSRYESDLVVDRTLRRDAAFGVNRIRIGSLPLEVEGFGVRVVIDRGYPEYSDA